MGRLPLSWLKDVKEQDIFMCYQGSKVQQVDEDGGLSN